MTRFILIYFPVICIAVAALHKLYSQDQDLSNGKAQPPDSIGYEKSPNVKRPTYTPPLNRGGIPERRSTPKQTTPTSKKTPPPTTQTHEGEKEKTSPNSQQKIQVDSYEPNNYLYRTNFINYAFEPILRGEATPYGREIYKCPKSADVYVINTDNEAYYFVSVNQRTGYISKALLLGVNETELSRSRSNKSSTTESYVPQIYTYKTRFNSKARSPVILAQPKSGSRVLYNVDKNDPVYVIERTNSQYYRVVIEGKRGYVSKYTLNQK